VLAGVVVVVAFALAGDDDGADTGSQSSSLASFAAGGAVQDLTADGDSIVWERQTGNTTRLTERRNGRLRDLPVPPAPNYAGTELGRDPEGQPVLVYSRCSGGPYSCDVFQLQGRVESPVRAVGRRGCDEFGPSVSAGAISYGEGERDTRCPGGVYVKRPGRQTSAIAGRARDTAINGQLVAWEIPTKELRLTRIGERGRVREIKARGTTGHQFLRPLLKGQFLYFVDHVLEDPERGVAEGYFIARTRATLPRAGFEHYGRGNEAAFAEVPTFALSGGDLLYAGDSKSDSRDGDRVITRDGTPEWSAGLGGTAP